MAEEHESVDGWLTGAGGINLYWRGWLPSGAPIATLLICHGACEHSGRYLNVVNTLVPEGFAVYGLDQRGHGRSGGTRVDIERYEDFLDDFDTFRRHVGSQEQPVFLLGHSLGGQIALAYALDHQDLLSGLVLSAPFLEVASVPRPLRPVGRLAGHLLPQARIPMVDLEKISKDPDVLADYKSDPLVFHGHSTLRFASAVEAQFAVLAKRAHLLRLPLLVQHGELDSIADPAGTGRLEAASGSLDQTVWWYPGLWHEIYNEPERDRPLGDLRDWLLERC